MKYIALREYPLRLLSHYANKHRVQIYISARKAAGEASTYGKQIAEAACELGYLLGESTKRKMVVGLL